MKRARTILLLALGAVALLCGQVSAFNMGDIDYWVGSGDNSAVMVIEWRAPDVIDESMTDVVPPDTEECKCLAWGYKFNGTKTGEDMFNAILAADPRLFAMVSGNTQYGKAVFALGYDDKDLTYGIDNGSTYYTQSNFASTGYVVGGYDDPDHYNLTSDYPSDLYWGGWYGPNWELWHNGAAYGGYTCPIRGASDYWTKDSSDPYGFAGTDGQWTFSETGMSQLTISNGSWMGWSVAGGGLEWEENSPNTYAWINYKKAPSEPEAAQPQQ